MAVTAQPDVTSVNREAAVALLDTGEVIPITNWFDGDGDDSTSEAAVAAVAGPCAAGHWYTFALNAFQPAETH